MLVLTSHFLPFLLFTTIVPKISLLNSFLFLLRSRLWEDVNCRYSHCLWPEELWPLTKVFLTGPFKKCWAGAVMRSPLDTAAL